MRFLKLVLSTIFTVTLVSGLVFSQVEQVSKPSNGGTSSRSNIILSTDKDYLIGSNDVLDIIINKAPKLSGRFEVNAGGNFNMYYVGIVEAKGKTIEEITNLITRRIKGKYLVNPSVSVRVSQSNSRAFFIQGAVQRPGTYQIDGNVSLLKLLTVAGGLKEKYGPTATVTRTRKPIGDTTSKAPDDRYRKVFKINIKQLLDGDLEEDIAIQSGDIVYIPIPSFFSVRGAVHKPGRFAIEETTILEQAISYAGGLTDKAGSLVRITRKVGLGETEYERFGYDMNNFSQKGNNDVVTIKKGDVIEFLEAGIVYVDGEVRRPGGFPITREGITLGQAVSLAEGIKYEGNQKRSLILRKKLKGEACELGIEIPGSDRCRIDVDIRAIRKGESADIFIRSGDRIYIPNSKNKAIGKAIFNILTRTLPVFVSRRF